MTIATRITSVLAAVEDISDPGELDEAFAAVKAGLIELRNRKPWSLPFILDYPISYEA